MSEEAGDRQLGHALQSLPTPKPPKPKPPKPSLSHAKAGETAIIVIMTPKSSFFTVLSLWLLLRM
jgi:hypothetical protein